MSTEDYVSQHGDALERAISAAVQKAIVARAADPLVYVARELSVAAGPTELQEELESLRAQLATVTAERDAALGALPVVATAPVADSVPELEGFKLTGVSLAVLRRLRTSAVEKRAAAAAIRINHYGHAPLSEQNHTYIGAGEKLVDDHWAASLAQF